MTICRGLYGWTIRPAKCTESAICEPPKPRRTTGTPGKSSLSVFHKPMLELPMNNTPPGLGISFLSADSNRAIDFSQRDESCSAVAETNGNTPAASSSRAVIF